jgi:uncharacterized protein (DUF983 family)
VCRGDSGESIFRLDVQSKSLTCCRAMALLLWSNGAGMLWETALATVAGCCQAGDTKVAHKHDDGVSCFVFDFIGLLLRSVALVLRL